MLCIVFNERNWGLFYLLDIGIRRVVVDGLEIFRFEFVGGDPVVVVQSGSDVSDEVFDEFRVVVGAFGDVFFVWPFQQAVEFAGGFPLHYVDQVFNPDMVGELRIDGDVGTLVVGAVVRNFLRAGAEAGDGDDDFYPRGNFAVVDFADERYIVVHQALYPRDGGGLVDEVWEGHFDMTGARFELFADFA